MINHAFTVLYNRTAAPPSGVLVSLERRLILPDVLRTVPERLGGQELVDLDIFAIRSLKILDASSYRLEVTKHDERLTYDLYGLSLDDENLQEFVAAWLGLGPTIINQLLSVREDVRKTYRSTDLTQEAAAVLITSYIDQVTLYNE